MSIKKMGSKLAQGVRQVKAQQVSASAKAEDSRVSLTAAPSAASGTKPAAPVPATSAASAVKPAVTARSKVGVAKTAATKSVLKPAARKPNLSGTQHPSRVWPD